MTPFEAARLIPQLITKREDDENKQITRFQLSNKSLSALCERKVITSTYMESLASEILEQGWCCFQVTSSSYGFLKLTTAQNFRRFNSDKLRDYI
ncbi:hypothetical protein [Pseudoalteromonas sp. T1lg23B]|uniref:hypothetical protein n=1 Tax=Pseudoalteromonas sp. T1lg23B TaxID=2077097 RepID=UPI000CF65E13|nr:hypothetical protein [Pseudoalteromonas sp. T1lg23B]